jgi:hypothetical protein
MHENLSLLSFWGLVFTLIAVTLFVVVYSYKKNTNKGEKGDMADDLRRRSVAVYLAEKSSAAEDISKNLRAVADEIDRLRADTTSIADWIETLLAEHPTSEWIWKNLLSRRKMWFALTIWFGENGWSNAPSGKSVGW